MSFKAMGTVPTTVIVSLAPDLSGNFVCDGVADDVEIQAACDYVNALGGGEVILLQGQFETTVQVDISANTLFRGIGFGSILNYTTIVGIVNWCLNVTGNSVQIRDLKITVPNGVGTANTRPSLIGAANVSDLYIDEVWLVQDPTAADDGRDWTQDCLDLDTCTRPRIRGCIFQNSQNKNVYADLCVDIYYAFNYNSNSEDGEQFQNGTRGIIEGNISHCETDCRDSVYMTVSNCWSEYFNFRTNVNCIFTGLQVDATGEGIYLDTSSYCIISNCTCTGVNDEGITVSQSSYCTISGNTITLADDAGIFINNCTNGMNISNNICGFNEEHGIWVWNSVANEGWGHVIVGNICEGNGTAGGNQWDGINIDGYAHEFTITNNQCNDNDNYGIYLVDANSTDNVVKNNILTGNATGAIQDVATDTAFHEIIIPVPNPSAYIGTHAAQQMLDGVDTTVGFGIGIPLQFQEVVTANIILVAAAAGNIRRAAATNWGKMSSTEAYNAGSDSIAAGQIAMLADDMSALDISAALTGIAAGDWIGLQYTREGSNVNDTIGDTVFCLGIRVRYV